MRVICCIVAYKGISTIVKVNQQDIDVFNHWIVPYSIAPKVIQSVHQRQIMSFSEIHQIQLRVRDQKKRHGRVSSWR